MKTMCKFILGLIIALPFVAGALDFKTIESSGVQRMYAAKTSSISSHSATGYGLGWSIYMVGGTADFTIKYSSVTGGDPNINISSTVYALSGQSVRGRFSAMVKNPILSIDRIDSATTAYIEIPYLAPKAPGSF